MLPPKSTIRLHGFYYYSDGTVETQYLDATENIEIVKVPVREIDSLLLSGKTTATDTISLIALAKINSQKHFNKNLLSCFVERHTACPPTTSHHLISRCEYSPDSNIIYIIDLKRLLYEDFTLCISVQKSN